jgi:hypothetical protein
MQGVAIPVYAAIAGISGDHEAAISGLQPFSKNDAPGFPNCATIPQSLLHIHVSLHIKSYSHW